MSLTRRQMMKGGAAIGALVGFGLSSRVLLPTRPSEILAPIDELASALYTALEEAGIREALVEYDHPLRQYHNRGMPAGGVFGIRLGRRERAMLVDLIHAALSPAGRLHLPDQSLLHWTGVSLVRVLFCGSPLAPPYQVLVTTGHLNLRIGGRNREGVAFGGPQVYGDQAGNEKVGLPGSIYRDQLDMGQRLVASLTAAERGVVRCPKAPSQTRIEVQGRRGRFDGLPVADLAAKNRQRVREFASMILANYREEDSAYAWECIEQNGGLDAFHLADYDQDHQGGRRAGAGPSQIFRLESPAAIFHYRGTPHLHAFLNVAMDGERPLSVGKVIGTNPARLRVDQTRALFEHVMRKQTGEEFAYYPAVSVAGDLRAGVIRTGDLYNLESWENAIEVVEVQIADLSEPVRAELEASNPSITSHDRARFAVPDGVAKFHDEYGINRLESIRRGPLLRDETIDFVTRHGFETPA